MNMKRRQFLKLSVGAVATGAAAAAFAGCESPSDGPTVDRDSPISLRLPPALQGSVIQASYGATELWPRSNTNALLLNQAYIGPTLVRQRGEQVNLSFVNALGEPSIIHWHGLNIPADMDGHPKDAVSSGQTYQYNFEINQRAGTYWYHAHPDQFTAKQAYLGFAGLVIVQDPEEQALLLPRGEFDVPLVLQDKRTSRSSTELTYNPTLDDRISGFLGNEVFVNGTPNAYLDVKVAMYRFRVLNGSNARVFRLAFDDGRAFHVIATDGGLLDRPYEVHDAYLAPGERIEVLVEFKQSDTGKTLKLETIEFSTATHGSSEFVQGAHLPVIRFNVRSLTQQSLVLPGALVDYERLTESTATRERIFALTMDHSRTKGIHMIDGKIFQMERSDYQIPFGEVEIWEIQNQAEGLHSMHVHGAHFQILERRFARAMTPVDYGWKDTVLVNDNETVRLAVRFDSFRGRYLFHCHFLEHEDDGMMVNIDVV